LTVAMKYAPLVLVMRRSRLAWRVSEMAIHSNPRHNFRYVCGSLSGSYRLILARTRLVSCHRVLHIAERQA
jgi:hypothetical protein